MVLILEGKLYSAPTFRIFRPHVNRQKLIKSRVFNIRYIRFFRNEKCGASNLDGSACFGDFQVDAEECVVTNDTVRFVSLIRIVRSVGVSRHSAAFAGKATKSVDDIDVARARRSY